MQELVREGAPLDAFGIGTQMGVSADAPYVDSVYKLVDIDGRPVLKLSAGKATAPGRKQVWRGHAGDVLALRDEPGVTGAEPLLEPVMRDGVRDRIRAVARRDARAVRRRPRGATRRRPVCCDDAAPVEVRHSDALVALTTSTRDEALRRSGADDG